MQIFVDVLWIVWRAAQRGKVHYALDFPGRRRRPEDIRNNALRLWEVLLQVCKTRSIWTRKGAARLATNRASAVRRTGLITRSLMAAGLAVAMVCAAAAPSFAHHSFAMFDRERETVLKGTVKELQWTNPHVFVQIVVPNEAGVKEEWSIESASPNMLFRQGWNPKAMKPGDKISVTINPLRSGGKGGYFLFAELPDGKTLGQRTRAPGSGPPG